MGIIEELSIMLQANQSKDDFLDTSGLITLLEQNEDPEVVKNRLQSVVSAHGYPATHAALWKFTGVNSTHPMKDRVREAMKRIDPRLKNSPVKACPTCGFVDLTNEMTECPICNIQLVED